MASPITVTIELEPESKEVLEKLIKVLEELNAKTPDGKLLTSVIADVTRIKEFGNELSSR